MAKSKRRIGRRPEEIVSGELGIRVPRAPTMTFITPAEPYSRAGDDAGVFGGGALGGPARKGKGKGKGKGRGKGRGGGGGGINAGTYAAPIRAPRGNAPAPQGQAIGFYGNPGLGGGGKPGGNKKGKKGKAGPAGRGGRRGV